VRGRKEFRRQGPANTAFQAAHKHIQHVLVEAAKLAPRQNHELAQIHEREKQKGNRNRATLAVARKMVAYLLAVDRREQEFIPAEDRSTAAA
jgi:hypothetical protein